MKKKRHLFFSVAGKFFLFGQGNPEVVPQWIHNADNGNGTYTNPVINSDYSDPDAIRVGK